MGGVGKIGRKRKDPDGTQVFSISVPKRVGQKLKLRFDGQYGQMSEYMTSLILKDQGISDDEILHNQLSELDKTIIELEKEILRYKERKTKIEESLRTALREKDRFIEKRISHLENLKKSKLKPNLAWYESRTDILMECDFDSPEEAMSWFAEQSKKAVM